MIDTNSTFEVSMTWMPERHAYLFLLTRTKPDGSREYFKLTPEVFPRHGLANLYAEDDMKMLEQESAERLLLAFATEARKHGIHPAADGAEMQAQKRHLEDMRKIAFHKLGCE